MDTKLQQTLLIAVVRTMISEVSERLGDENPYSQLVIDDLSIPDLVAVKRNLHEVLYAPPPRSRI